MKKQEILNKYNISEATLRNWKKLHYIEDINNIDEKLILKIINEKTSNRRNKKNSKGHLIPTSYVKDQRIISIIESILNWKEKHSLKLEEVLHFVIIKILKENDRNEVPLEVEKILGSFSLTEECILEFNNIKMDYDTDNDFLGCLYMSLLSIGNKDKNGIFYTPFSVVQKIMKIITIKENSKILDPGCGSGNFLICAYKKMKENGWSDEKIVGNIYGYDIDKIAVLLAKINLYILARDVSFDSINIKCCDFLNDSILDKYDIIVGNPPWGKKYSIKEKEKFIKKYGKKFASSDSFSQFIIKSFSILNEHGVLSFVLPSSILNIAVHKDIREFLLQYNLEVVEKIGREFEEIVTDVILIKVVNKLDGDKRCIYNNEEIYQDIFVENPNCNFILPEKKAVNILNKMEKIKSYYLVDGIDYALGVVTGDNDSYVLNNKIPLSEVIISGKEITKYNLDYKSLNKYIIYDKDKFQQVAPIDLYRCKNKIIYKFIGKKLMFAPEIKGFLTLNSANIICVKDKKDIYYISAILNSRVIQLFFDTKYDTHKVLKNHIQSFPIFDFSDYDTKKIISLSKKTNPMTTYNEKIEDIIYRNLDLTLEEISYLKNRYN